ncbi:hypothetical protein QAD02_008067 [Eretmocerus hayati]|uniref:Uncharacterized protein n=1 Tax=Eretmocerus hayati TaxID=131215 RepID=A0ACC2N9T4_9HYME|nr:hypothetical protein QAD02_008067 [Eretmocerus hayati]
MNKKEAPRQFYNWLKVFINAALTAAKEDLTEENADLDDKPHLELIALKTFVKGLLDTLKPAIALSKPKTLIEALQSVEQLEKFSLKTNLEAELYFTRSQEMSGPNPQPQNIRPNSFPRQVHEKQGQRIKMIDNNDPNSYHRNSMPYNLNRDDMQLPPPSSINSQAGIDAHPNLRYGNNPSQPPSILKRTESRAPSPYQRPNSSASCPVSPGRNYNQNQYNRNQYPYNMQYPYPLPPTTIGGSTFRQSKNFEDKDETSELESTFFKPDEAQRMKKQIQEISWWWDNYASKSEPQYPDRLNESAASAPAAVGETSLEGEFFDNEHGSDTSLTTNLGGDPVPNEEVGDWWARSFLPPAVTPTPLLMRMKHLPSRESFLKSTPLPLEGRRRIPSFWKNVSTIPQENSEESDSEDENQEKASTARNGTAQGKNHPNQAGDLPTASISQQHNLNDDIQPDLDYVQPPTMTKTSTRECVTFAKDHIVHSIPANLDLSTPNHRLLLDLGAINIEQFRKRNLTVVHQHYKDA